MIFDLPTLKDTFNRWIIYPSTEYSDVFIFNDYYVSSYDIAEGRYFGLNHTFRGEAVLFKLNYRNLLNYYDEPRDVNSIVFEYRSNHPFYVTTLTDTEEVVEEFPASDTFRKGSIKYVEDVQHYNIEDGVVFTSHVHGEDGSVHKGDFLIIKKFEFLTI